jgi:hypothetical protein
MKEFVQRKRAIVKEFTLGNGYEERILPSKIMLALNFSLCFNYDASNQASTTTGVSHEWTSNTPLLRREGEAAWAPGLYEPWSNLDAAMHQGP